jgi:hypothetical protein
MSSDTEMDFHENLWIRYFLTKLNSCVYSVNEFSVIFTDNLRGRLCKDVYFLIDLVSASKERDGENLEITIFNYTLQNKFKLLP